MKSDWVGEEGLVLLWLWLPIVSSAHVLWHSLLLGAYLFSFYLSHHIGIPSNVMRQRSKHLIPGHLKVGCIDPSSGPFLGYLDKNQLERGSIRYLNLALLAHTQPPRIMFMCSVHAVFIIIIVYVISNLMIIITPVSPLIHRSWGVPMSWISMNVCCAPNKKPLQKQSEGTQLKSIATVAKSLISLTSYLI